MSSTCFAQKKFYLELSRTTERQPSPFRTHTRGDNPISQVLLKSSPSIPNSRQDCHIPSCEKRFCTQSQNLRNCIRRVRGRHFAVLTLPSIASVFTTYMYMYLLCWYKAVRTKEITTSTLLYFTGQERLRQQRRALYLSQKKEQTTDRKPRTLFELIQMLKEQGKIKVKSLPSQMVKPVLVTEMNFKPTSKEGSDKSKVSWSPCADKECSISSPHSACIQWLRICGI